MNHLTPKEILKALTDTGAAKAEAPAVKLVILGIMAGAYIAFAGAASTMGSFNLLAESHTYGLGRMLCGVIFTGGLIIVTLAGAELFTGNSLITLAVLNKRTTAGKMIRNWVIVYIANLAGSILVAFLVSKSGIFDAGEGLLGAVTVKTAAGKVNMGFTRCLISGILCNWLVCLAVWMAAGAKFTAGKAVAVFFPIWMFATCGFEHSIANMYFISAGIFAAGSGGFEAMTAPEAFAGLGWQNMFSDNLLPVTIGNLIGGIVFVAFGYFMALKERDN